MVAMEKRELNFGVERCIDSHWIMFINLIF